MNMQTRIAKECTQSSGENSEINEYFIAHRDSFIAVIRALLTDFVNINPCYRSVDSARDLACFVKRLDHERLGFLSVTLPDLMSSLFSWTQGGNPSYNGWRKASRAEYPAFLGRLFFEVYNQGENHEMAFSQIYQVCVLFKKLRGPYRKTVLRKNLLSFVEVDSSLGLIDFQSEPLKPILTNAQALIQSLFKDVELTPDMLLPRPGPGATNTPVDKHLRYVPHTVYTELDEMFDYLNTFYFHHWDPVEDARRYMCLPVKEEAESRYKQIPKYLGKPRGICIEENEMQFFQQALKRYLYKLLESHPATRGRINFTSQELNRNLALAASVTQEFATLDAQEASDRVARYLVHLLFLNTPIFHQLDAVSTRLIRLPNEQLLYANKFAPMGSGVCFPVMAVTFWALIRSIIKLSSIDDSEKLSKQVYVYGDDIIIPTQAVQAVYDYLPLFGMKLNVDKSFTRGLFRESCGIHAYNGVDVTPVYVNYVTKTSQDRSDTTVLLSLIAKESQFHERGLHNTSQCLQNLVRKHYWEVPLVGANSPVLGFKRDGVTDYEEVLRFSRSVKWDPDTQQPLYNIQTVVPEYKDEGLLVEGCRYVRNLVSGKRPGTIYPQCEDDPWMPFRRDPKCFVLTSEDLGNSIPGDVEKLRVKRRWLLMSHI